MGWLPAEFGELWGCAQGHKAPIHPRRAAGGGNCAMPRLRRNPSAAPSTIGAHRNVTLEEPTEASPMHNDSFGADLQDVLKRLFRLQTEPNGKLLDAERFLSMQERLSWFVFSEELDRMYSMSKFLELSASGGKAFESYSKWQANSLKGRGFNESEIVDLLERCFQSAPTSTSQCQRFSRKKSHAEAQRLQAVSDRMKSSAVDEAVLHEAGRRQRRRSELDAECSKEALNQRQVRAKQLAGMVSMHSEKGSGHVCLSSRQEPGKVEDQENHENRAFVNEQSGPPLSNEAKEKSRVHSSRDASKFRSESHLPTVSERERGLLPPSRPKKEKEKHGPTESSVPGLSNNILPEDATTSLGTHLHTLPKFQELAARAQVTPKARASSVSSLGTYLTVKAETEEEKAWVIFAWICHHIHYDVDGLNGRAPKKPNDPESVLKNRLCVCAGYSNLYQSLCEEVGLIVEYVVGYARGSENPIGVKLTDKDLHGWNAVRISGKWFLVDSTWGAGTASDTQFTPSFRPHFFGVAPEVLAYSHYPEKKEWQLLRHPNQASISYDEFLSQPHVWTEPFLRHGIGFIPERPSGAILLKGTNQSSVQLKVPKGIKLMAKLDDEGDRCFQERCGDTATVFFRAPKGPSQHKLCIYAKQGSSTGSFDAVCSFSVVGSVGPGGFVEPWFPNVWEDAFTANGLKFKEQLPMGLLKPDASGRIAVQIQVPHSNKVIAHLEGKDNGKVSASCHILDAEKDTVEISYDKVDKDRHHKLVIFANDMQSTSFQAAVSYRIGA